MARLTVLMGAPGAGKSTYAYGAGLGEVVSTEAYRMDPNAKGVMPAAYKRIHELLAAGEDAVFDSTGANPNVRKAALSIARRHGAEAEVHVFDTPVELCVQAQRTRKFPVPEQTVRQYHADIRRQIPALEEEGFSRVKVTRRRWRE